MTGGRIKPSLSRLLQRISAEMKDVPAARDARATLVVPDLPAAQATFTGDPWDAAFEFWKNEPPPTNEARRMVAADLVHALGGLEGSIATGEAPALLEDHRRLQQGFEIVYDGAPPPDVVQFLGELRALVADRTRDFVEQLKEDLLGSSDAALSILDDDARSYAVIIVDALRKRAPIDPEVLDGAIQHLRATLSRSDYRAEHTRDLDVLAKRLEWLYAAVDLRSPALESR